YGDDRTTEPDGVGVGGKGRAACVPQSRSVNTSMDFHEIFLTTPGAQNAIRSNAISSSPMTTPPSPKNEAPLGTGLRERRNAAGMIDPIGRGAEARHEVA